jgi:hypothetical protein
MADGNLRDRGREMADRHLRRREWADGQLDTAERESGLIDIAERRGKRSKRSDRHLRVSGRGADRHRERGGTEI